MKADRGILNFQLSFATVILVSKKLYNTHRNIKAYAKATRVIVAKETLISPFWSKCKIDFLKTEIKKCIPKKVVCKSLIRNYLENNIFSVVKFLQLDLAMTFLQNPKHIIFTWIQCSVGIFLSLSGKKYLLEYKIFAQVNKKEN